jgi:hypothetical protein
MANLSTLLTDRNLVARRGIERTSQGQIFYFTHTNVSGTLNGNPCTYSWSSPGTGVAVIETWGAGGTGGRQCCCHSGGVPGNPGAYSKISVNVTPSSVVCGWVGCSPTGGTLCYNGRSQCSVACLLNTSCDNILIAQGGFGGYIMCSTGTAAYCCMVASGFCHTLTNTFCGIICNVGGPNGAVGAPASGGDINLPGGISCSRYWDCCQYHKCNIEQTVALPPGVKSNCGSSCFRFFRSEFPGYGIANNGYSELSTALNGAQGAIGHRHFCWNSNQPCACYEYDGCRLNAAAMPGLTGIPCPGVRANGHKGGHGAIKITFYS